MANQGSSLHENVGPSGEYIPPGYYGISRQNDQGGRDLVTVVPKAALENINTAKQKQTEARQAASAPVIHGDQQHNSVQSQANQIKAAYKAGQISREEAIAKLRALGME
jgi:hypothetical protein